MMIHGARKESGAERIQPTGNSPETAPRTVTKLLVTGQCRKLVHCLFAATTPLRRKYCSEILPEKKLFHRRTRMNTSDFNRPGMTEGILFLTVGASSLSSSLSSMLVTVQQRLYAFNGRRYSRRLPLRVMQMRLWVLFFLVGSVNCAYPQNSQTGTKPIVLHAARLLDIEAGRVVQPGEVLVEGERIREAGSNVTHPPGVEVIDLGDTTLMPGLIDAHVHLFLHPGAEDL